MNISFKEHRYLDLIDKGIEKGYPLLFLHGKGISDYYMLNYHLGVTELEKSLYIYFYNIQNVDCFAVVKNSEVVFYNKEGEPAKTSEIFSIENEEAGLGEGISDEDFGTSSEDADEITNKAENATSNLSSFENDLHFIEQNYNDKKIAVFFSELEWSAGLYSSDKKLELLRRVSNWTKSKKSFAVVSIKEPKLLEEYGFDVDETSPNMIYLGNPAQVEITKAYRRYIGVNFPNIEIDEDEFDDIVSAIQASKKNLRESIRVLKLVLANCKKNSITKLTKSLFEASFTKVIKEKITFDDVILNADTKKEILQKVKTFHTDKENKSKGIIMYGPSGTGKTYIAKAIAHEYNMNFMAPTLADLKGEYIGQTSGKVKRIFEEARANAPTVLFLDEIDTMFTRRNSNDGDSFLKDMVNQFLVEIDGAKTGEQDIFIVGATNRLEVIDPAIISRLNPQIKVDLPNKENRERIFDIKFNTFKLSEQPWKEGFLNKTEGMSGRDIDIFVKGIKESKIDEKNITEIIFYSALKSLEFSFIDEFKRDMKGTIEIKSSGLIKFEDVIGYEEVKKTLNMELNYILSSYAEKEKMKRFGIVPKRGNLLYGPPGNGKTTFAEALAGEKDFYYIKILSKDFASSFSDNQLSKIETIFNNTIKLSKITDKKGVVLFFDEVDTLIDAQRIDPTVRGTLLNYLENKEGIKAKDSKVILISATNTPIEFLDSASVREGRFDVKLMIDYPTKKEGAEILKKFFDIDEQIKTDDLNENYYTNLYENLENKAKETLTGKMEKMFSANKNIGIVPIVNLKAEKERIKAIAFYDESIEKELIVIKEAHK